MKLAFGYSRGIPEDVKTAWGARLIAPDDLLHDRQDLVAENAEAKSELIAWLNGTGGNGAIAAALDWLRKNSWTMPQREEAYTLYEDKRGKIVGSTNGSHGYIYTAGWLKNDVDRTRYEIVRGPITVERWHTHYGWSKEEAERMGDGSSEVRIFAVNGEERRELTSERAGEFEMGYGGTGPHTTAAAIAADRGITGTSAATLKQLVPEVFTPAGRENMTVTVYAADIDARIGAATY